MRMSVVSVVKAVTVLALKTVDVEGLQEYLKEINCGARLTRR